MPKSFFDQRIDYCFQGPGFVWVNVPVNDANQITFSLTGNDMRNIIPQGIPRPLFGGVYLGPVDQLFENRQVSVQNIEKYGSFVPDDFVLQNEVSDVTGNVAFNGDPMIAAFFRLPGRDMGYQFTEGGQSIPPKYNMVVIRFNKLKRVTLFYEAHLYHRGIILPAGYPTSFRQAATIKLDYRVARGKDTNGCDLPVGQQTMNGWFFKVDSSGNNIMVDPNNPSADISIPSAPLISIAGYGSAGF